MLHQAVMSPWGDQTSPTGVTYSSQAAKQPLSQPPANQPPLKNDRPVTQEISDRGLCTLSFSPHRTSGQLYTAHRSEPRLKDCRRGY